MSLDLGGQVSLNRDNLYSYIGTSEQASYQEISRRINTLRKWQGLRCTWSWITWAREGPFIAINDSNFWPRGCYKDILATINRILFSAHLFMSPKPTK